MQRRQDYISITTGSSALDNLLEGPFVEQLGAGRARGVLAAWNNP